MLFLLSSVRNVVHTNILKAINTVRRLFKKDLIVCLCAHVRACVCTYKCVYAPLCSCLEPAEARGGGFRSPGTRVIGGEFPSSCELNMVSMEK